MRRLTIFAKGNLDVKNSLHSFFLGGKSFGMESTKLFDNGIPEPSYTFDMRPGLVRMRFWRRPALSPAN